MTKIMLGDCLDQLKELEDNSIDSIVTDPPYGLSFMGKAWDYDVPTAAIWKECLRVLKPGGHLLAFGGTRTYHRLVVNIEDAGFEIRDQIMWIYGSGFPKSMDISKAIDKEAGSEREVLGVDPVRYARLKNQIEGSTSTGENWEHGGRDVNITAPATEDAKKWSGWGTALKPANEPICLARKPLSEKTVAKNVLKHGVGGLNVDASRIEATGESLKQLIANSGRGGIQKEGFVGGTLGADEDSYGKGEVNAAGRFPANILFDEAAAAVLDEQSGQSKSPKGGGIRKTALGIMNDDAWQPKETVMPGYADAGGASRFFYVAKASKKDRGEGNIHPTVKPIKLMEYLVKLVTPEGGRVLDPFMGSGTTGVAALGLGFKFVGIERDDKYFEISEQRIRDTLAARKLAKAALNKTKEVV